MHPLLSPPPLTTISFNLFFSFDTPCWINPISPHLPSISASLQFLTLKTFFQSYLPHSTTSFSSFPTLFLPSLCFFTSILTPSVFLLMGLCKNWGSLLLCCVVQSHFLQWSGFLFPLLRHRDTHMQTHVHIHTHTCASSLTWSCCFFIQCIFSMSHAECVISSGWCPPLEK